jgi:hypothetical protein
MIGAGADFGWDRRWTGRRRVNFPVAAFAIFCMKLEISAPATQGRDSKAVET